jgi:hypothetical protein
MSPNERRERRVRCGLDLQGQAFRATLTRTVQTWSRNFQGKKAGFLYPLGIPRGSFARRVYPLRSRLCSVG